ncbi:MAG: CoA-binding protein [Winogradskyella sp.]
MNKKTLVIGASLKPERYSNIAINKLKSNNHDVVAYGLKTGIIKDVNIDTDLIDYKDLDTVTLYLNPSRQEAYYNYIVGLNPKRVIFNPGTENPEFYQILKENNIAYEAACTLVLLSTNQY